MNDMRIYAPNAEKMANVKSRHLVKIYKSLIEVVCVTGQENGFLKITDKKGNRLLADNNSVFTKREFKTLYPQFFELMFPSRRKLHRSS